jgi:hypothetical protein
MRISGDNALLNLDGLINMLSITQLDISNNLALNNFCGGRNIEAHRIMLLAATATIQLPLN